MLQNFTNVILYTHADYLMIIYAANNSQLMPQIYLIHPCIMDIDLNYPSY